jgi:hypothetical protein
MPNQSTPIVWIETHWPRVGRGGAAQRHHAEADQPTRSRPGTRAGEKVPARWRIATNAEARAKGHADGRHRRQVEPSSRAARELLVSSVRVVAVTASA